MLQTGGKNRQMLVFGVWCWLCRLCRRVAKQQQNFTSHASTPSNIGMSTPLPGAICKKRLDRYRILTVPLLCVPYLLMFSPQLLRGAVHYLSSKQARVGWQAGSGFGSTLHVRNRRSSLGGRYRNTSSPSHINVKFDGGLRVSGHGRLSTSPFTLGPCQRRRPPRRPNKLSCTSPRFSPAFHKDKSCPVATHLLLTSSNSCSHLATLNSTFAVESIIQQTPCFPPRLAVRCVK